jgi:hypothetical protein
LPSWRRQCALAAALGGCGGDSDGGGGEAPSDGGQASAEGTMPDLTGASRTEAEEQIASTLEFSDLRISYEDSSEPAGTVIGQSPEPGTPLTPGKLYRVKLTMSDVRLHEPCDEDNLAPAEIGGSVSDCDPVTKQIVSEGGKCEGRARVGILGNLECDPSRVCGGYVQWTKKGRDPPCELGKPVETPGYEVPGYVPPSEGVPQEGDPCTPGEPLPPGLVCKPK